jgi:hypothetical protein
MRERELDQDESDAKRDAQYARFAVADMAMPGDRRANFENAGLTAT